MFFKLSKNKNPSKLLTIQYITISMLDLATHFCTRYITNYSISIEQLKSFYLGNKLKPLAT